ncbi:MAG: hypothetical protein WAO91_03180 [Candidatus Nitrosotenuis sp.]
MSFDEILRRLDEMDARLSRIESVRPSRNVMTEERTEISEEGEFDSTETATVNNATVTTKRIPVCDQCGNKLENSFAVCKEDGKKLCKNCSISFRNRTICPQHLREVYPLSRPAYKVLILVANSIDDANNIHKISHIPKKEVMDILDILVEGGYVEKHAFFRRRITEMGLEAISGYSQIYGNSADMRQLDEEVKEFVQGQM